MRRSPTSPIVLGLLLSAAAIGIGSVWAGQANHGIKRLKIGNKTQSFIVESITELDTIQVGQKTLRQFKVTVKNGYSQPVVAYAFEQQDADVVGAAVERNGASVGWALPPNATDKTLFTAPAEGKVRIDVAAVLLEDGTGDGDTTSLVRLKEVRAGVRVAYQQSIPLLDQALNSNVYQGTEAALEALEKEISATVDQRTVDDNLRRGFGDAKNHLLSELRQLRSSQAVDYRSEIARIKAHLEERVAKL